MGSRISDSRGVTLIELLVVLALFTISLGIVRVAVTSNSVRELTAACNELQADLRYAQRQSVVENRQYQVFFPLTGNGYRVLRQDGTFGVTSVIKEKSFDGDIILVGTTAVGSAVIYTTRGTTGDACTITLRNNEYKADLTVNVGSGRISRKDFTRLGS